MAFEDQNPNETIYTDEATGSAAQATTAKLRVQIQGVTIGEDTLTINFTDSVSGTFDDETGVATIPITPGLFQGQQNQILGRLSPGTGVFEAFLIPDLPDQTVPQGGDSLMGQRASDGALVQIDVGNLPTGGGGEVNLGNNIGSLGENVFAGKVGVTFEYHRIEGVDTLRTDLVGFPAHMEVGFQDTTRGFFVGRTDVGTGKPTFVSSTDTFFRERFQGNLPKSVISSNRALTQVQDYKRLVDLDNSADLTITLPDPAGAQFAGQEPGHFCDMRVRSGANFASLTAGVTNTFRHQNGYGGAVNVGTEDTIFLGYVRNRGIGQVFRLYRETDRWLFQGDYRIVETDDLTLNGPLHGGGGGGGGLTIDDLPAQTGLVGPSDLLEVWDDSAQQSVKSTLNDVLALVAPPGTGTGLYSAYIVPAGNSRAQFLAAVTTADAAGVGVYLPESLGQLNWSDGGGETLNGTTLLDIVGDGPAFTVVDFGDATPSRGNREFFVNRPIRIRGIRFQNGNEIWSTFGADTAIDLFSIEDCEFDTYAAAMHNEVGGGLSPTLSFGTIRFNRNVCTNSSSDTVNMRLGTSAGLEVPVRRVEMFDNEIIGCPRRNLAVFYDAQPPNAVWPILGFGIARGNQLRDQVATENDAFGIRIDATDTVLIDGNHFENMRRGTTPSGQEPIYTKANRVTIVNNTLINSGESQGCITLKGVDGGNPGQLDVAIVANNTIICNVAATFEVGIWVQRPHAVIHDNRILGPFNFGINGQTNDVYDKVSISRNHIEMNGNTVVNAIRRGGQGNDIAIDGNQIYMENTNANANAVRIDTGGVGLISQPSVRGNHISKRIVAAGNGVQIIEQGGDILTDVIVSKNYFHGYALGDHFVEFIGSIGGAVRVRDNEHTGTTPSVPVEPGGNTVDETNNSWQ